MRDQQTIIQDIGLAASAGNMELLQKLVTEIEPIDTPEARAAMQHGKGILLETGRHFSDAERAYRQGLEICLEQGYTRSAANFHDSLARVYRALGRLDEALAFHDQAIQVFRDLGEEHALSSALSNKGVTLQYQNDVPAALELMLQRLDLANGIGDQSSIGRLKGAVADLYSNVDDLPSALMLYEEAIEIFQRINDKQAEALYYSNMGGLYHKMGGLTKARDLFDRSNALYSEQGNESGMALNHSHIAMCLITEGRDEEGLVQLERSEELNKRTGNVLRMGKLYIDKAQALMRLDRYEDAEKAFDQYREVGVETPQDKILYLMTYAEMFVHQGQIEEARRSCIEAQEICQQIGSKYLEATAVMGLRDYAKADNDLDAYIRYNDEYQRLNDEVHGAEAKLKMAMQAKEREMEAERAERDRERAILYSTLPDHVADRLIRGEDVSGDHHDRAAVLFLDIAGFTTHSSSLDPQQTTRLLENIFHQFDEICTQHGVIKIKTIGDSYLAVAFGREESLNAEGLEMVRMGSEFHEQLSNQVAPSHSLERRASEGGGVRCWTTERGTIDIKGKGPMTTYWLEGA